MTSQEEDRAAQILIRKTRNKNKYESVQILSSKTTHQESHQLENVEHGKTLTRQILISKN